MLWKNITANKLALQTVKSRNIKWAKEQNYRVGAGNKNSRYTSNKTHYSPTDPDARISVKPGEVRKLNYLSQLTADSANHVITDIRAYHACGKDNKQLQDITIWVEQRLWKNCVADTGYSSGENYAFLVQCQLTCYISPHGTYKDCPDGFTYDKKENHFICAKGIIISFKKVFLDYPLRKKCLKKSQEKRITITYYREKYERTNSRIESTLGRKMKAIRKSTEEPVFGKLTQFMGLRKINTIGLVQADRVMHIAAIAYNIKKYLIFITKKVKSDQSVSLFILFNTYGFKNKQRLVLS